MAIKIRTDDRVICVGQTGSGKTKAMQYMTRSLRRLIVIDPKDELHDWNLTDWNEDAKERLLDGEGIRVRSVAPMGLADSETQEFYESIFRAAIVAQNCVIYVDEFYAVVPPGQRPPPWCSAVWTRGRSLGVGGWASTQRPSWVPTFIISEAQHKFCFRLEMETDRKKMAGIMGDDVLTPIPAADPHGFYYRSIGTDRPVYEHQLDLKQPAPVRSVAPV